MKIKKAELEKLYNEMTNRALAKKLGCSVSTLNVILEKSGIKKKGKGNHNKRPVYEVID